MSKKKHHKQQFDGQLEDEDVLLVFRRHPIVMRKGLIITSVFILVGAIIGSVMSSKTITPGDFLIGFFRPIFIAFLISLIPFFYFWIGWYFTITVVTNERLLQIHQEGIFRRRSVNDVSLNRILSVNYDQKGVLENLLGFGTIVVQTLVGDLVIHKVGHPAQRQREIITVIKESGVELEESTEAAIN